jgi:flagellar hook assembly protein FlgD
MHLAPGSQFIDAGTDVGLPFNGLAPDLGCFESDYVTVVYNEKEVRIADFKILQNYPNPFNPTTTIRFKVPHGGTQHVVSLRVYDILGREITTLVNEVKTAGAHTVQWDGKNSAGQKVGSGVYFYQLKGDAGFVSTKKMIVLD